ncbi:hypothetical protein TSAR_013091 [Trichomalopsis sarcophagae]|uniref:Uncharacterized protein n=1 Tax=Trichomalopsis sarcophagae TaxID=543379 RepID=A0A232EZX2_9HYME|nr:hypothetical protein TSAR_013091 [Trichomalopsis sarcophagae]
MYYEQNVRGMASYVIILWDKIILRGDNAVLDFKNMNTKYYFWDDGNGLSDDFPRMSYPGSDSFSVIVVAILRLCLYYENL